MKGGRQGRRKGSQGRKNGKKSGSLVFMQSDVL